ncbi:ribbon-helix-helix domain-containing protein [Lacticaseibacillus thailandensis]|uniref:Ribbon-helix-helix protein CopG domain-containing protein n=1 Tax=Lacticaseibacillus thailandensis DSM 22698 = JCM 13996 TaxID=1423810 RepID=A0A0R2C9L1_9LACO|nr:ribbon-helix-helix domain-containing protein [Lacticaseibacillus thailandensis]KRM86692.1 hypothetical protein FD19_GL001739 [Lacticaseibacillus thailandensis DSM 22698 = JCM 13996]
MTESTDITIKLPADIMDQLAKETQATGESNAEVIAQALKEYLYTQQQQREFIFEDDCND